MCGIAGYIGSDVLTTESIDRTLALMQNRGPDGQHAENIDFADKHCYLLHSRLNIIDLNERSDQPFHYNGNTLIFNGEIYNYIEVREKLKSLDHQFITDSDTEVLIHALDEWGTDALNIIEGMWAFAFFNRKEQKLMISRDPFGEKPLYIYRTSDGGIYFGSEVKFLSALANKQFTPNHNHLCRFMVNGYKSIYKSTETFFQEIEEIPRASLLEIDANGRTTKQCYWHPKIKVNQDLSFDDAVAQARQLLIDSVELRLRSDIPIAFCMSGGVDSNSLISIAKRVFDYDVHGFTILNSDSRYEEQDMIDVGVTQLGIKHSSYPIPSESFIENMQQLVGYHDSPVLTITFYLDWLLQREISRHGYHISTNGTAADELFSGYFDHQLMYLYDVRNEGDFFQESVKNWQREVAPIVRNPFLQDPEAFIKRPFQRDQAYLNCEKYSTLLQTPWQEAFSETYYRDGLLQNRMMNEIFQETIPVLLHEIDLNAMYFSVENRAPFLDRKLFEFCHSIPVKHLIKNGSAKAVLREAMRGIVPDPILDNSRKVGFNAPVMDLLDIDNPKVQEYLLQDSPIWEIVKRESIESLIKESHLPNSDSKFLFSFLSSKMFLEKFS